MLRLRPFPIAIFLLSSLAAIALTLAVSTGSQAIGLATLFNSLFTEANKVHEHILFELRLPRALTAFFAGGALALAGAFMQSLLRNPLADPYVLGTSGGASVGMLVGFLFGFPLIGLVLIGFGGACFSLLILLLVTGFYHDSNKQKLLLVGVVMAMGWNALVLAILNLMPNHDLKSALFWMMGDLSLSPVKTPWLLLAICTLFTASFLAWPLNLLRLGPEKAASLGLSVRKVEWTLLIGSALLTALAVSLAGNIGFVGLVVPHFIRLWLGSDHRVLLPSCILAGGSLVTMADSIARSVMAPQECPVGVIMAFIGIPLFLLVLLKSRETTRWSQ